MTFSIVASRLFWVAIACCSGDSVGAVGAGVVVVAGGGTGWLSSSTILARVRASMKGVTPGVPLAKTKFSVRPLSALRYADGIGAPSTQAARRRSRSARPRLSQNHAIATGILLLFWYVLRLFSRR